MELLITTLAGLSMALGLIVARFAKNPHTVERLSLALALGAMCALAFFDLIPEAFEIAQEYGFMQALIAVVAGAAILWGLDLLMPDHAHAHGNHNHHDHSYAGEDDEELHAVHIGIMTTIALIVHNILEGMVVYAISAESPMQGIIYALGVTLHNLPFGMLIFTSLAHEQRGIRVVAILGALLSTALGGVIMMLGLSGPEIVRELMECVALGMVGYIVLAELLPQVVHDIRQPSTLAAVMLGFGLVFLATLLV